MTVSADSSANVGIYPYTVLNTFSGGGTSSSSTEELGVFLPLPAPNALGPAEAARIKPGDSATFAFDDDAQAAVGAIQWHVWSSLPGNTTAVWSNPSTNAPPHSNTLTVQTNSSRPYGFYAIGVDVSSNPMCETSDDTTVMLLQVTDDLQIFVQGTSNRVDGTTQQNVVGQLVPLIMELANPNAALNSFNWTVDGSPIGGYGLNSTTTTTTNLITPVTLTNQTLNAYWITPGSTSSYNVQAQANITNTSGNGNDVDANPATVAYNALGPTLNSSPFSVAPVTAVNESQYAGVSLDPVEASSYGIDGTVSISVPSGGDPGTIGVVSVINSDSSYYADSAGKHAIDNVTSAEVDGCPFPTPFTAVSDSLFWSDGPSDLVQKSSGLTSVHMSQSFSTYFMFTPAGSQSIPVTFGELDWAFSGVNKSPSWDKITNASEPQSPLSATVSNTLPQFSGADVTTMSATICPNTGG